jgi:hypothetical protein
MSEVVTTEAPAALGSFAGVWETLDVITADAAGMAAEVDATLYAGEDGTAYLAVSFERDGGESYFDGQVVWDETRRAWVFALLQPEKTICPSATPEACLHAVWAALRPVYAVIGASIGHPMRNAS